MAAISAVVLAALEIVAQPIELDVTRVALFNSGVGYFECVTEVEGSATAELRFRSDQINDILKSLVVEDSGGGTVGIVSYASRDPIEKTLKSFAVDITGKPTLHELLDQLRGEPVEVAGPRALRGVILGVETREVAVGEHVIQQDILNLLTETGMEQLLIADLRGLRLTNPRIDAELRKALETLASGRDADKKSVFLRFEGTGRRSVRVGYLLEAPVWKTSYRLVLSDGAKPFLQGWATIENATERDWKDVRLSLVSGRPISFRMDLYTPLYVPRPLEQMELYASLRPPVHEAAPPPALFQKAKSAQDAAARPGAPLPRRTAGALDLAAEEGTEKLRAEAPPEPLRLAEAGVESLALAAEAGELFEYSIKTPVSIARQQSAMLPIVNQNIDGEKVSIYNPAVHSKYPLNGLELLNTTGLNLMQGPVTVFDGGVYAGDAKLPDLRPDERRLISYALDLGVEVIVNQKPAPEELVSLQIARGVLKRKHRYIDRREYVIRNKTARPRSVILEQAYTPGWELVTPKEAYGRTANLLRFRTTVPPQETVSYPVELARIAEQTIALAEVGLDEIRIYLRTTATSPALEKALARVIELRTELDRLGRERKQHEDVLKELEADQGRVRENLKVLRADTDAYQQQLSRFTDLEGKITAEREALAAARQTEERQRKELESYLLSLNVE